MESLAREIDADVAEYYIEWVGSLRRITRFAESNHRYVEARHREKALIAATTALSPQTSPLDVALRNKAAKARGVTLPTDATPEERYAAIRKAFVAEEPWPFREVAECAHCQAIIEVGGDCMCQDARAAKVRAGPSVQEALQKAQTTTVAEAQTYLDVAKRRFDALAAKASEVRSYRKAKP
jgi:hypothetical protein